jgi:rubrerythrin
MNKKHDLIRLLEECIALEDEAIPLYTQHLENPEFFKGVSPEDVERVKEALMTLAHDSQSHRWIFESLLDKMKDASKDV